MRLSLTAVLIAGFAVIASASPVPVESTERRPSDCGADYCAGTNNTLDNDWFCGDSRLGPKILPKMLPLAAEVYGYDRLGGLCPGAFLAKWYDATEKSYVYPPQNGFQLDTGCQPIQGTQTLPVGTKLDRFGSEYGSFFSPAGAPYNQRALPPSSLDTPSSDPTYPNSYHVYVVAKEFDVSSGPIAGWFGQPGQGTQYETSSDIMTLIHRGYLKRVDQKDHYWITSAVNGMN